MSSRDSMKLRSAKAGGYAEESQRVLPKRKRVPPAKYSPDLEADEADLEGLDVFGDDDEYAEPERRKLRSHSEHEINTRAKSNGKREVDLADGAEALLGLADLAALGGATDKPKEEITANRAKPASKASPVKKTPAIVKQDRPSAKSAARPAKLAQSSALDLRPNATWSAGSHAASPSGSSASAVQAKQQAMAPPQSAPRPPGQLRRAATHVSIAYYIFYQQRQNQLRSLPPANMPDQQALQRFLDPTHEARQLRDRQLQYQQQVAQSQQLAKQQQQQQQQPAASGRQQPKARQITWGPNAGAQIQFKPQGPFSSQAPPQPQMKMTFIHHTPQNPPPRAVAAPPQPPPQQHYHPPPPPQQHQLSSVPLPPRPPAWPGGIGLPAKLSDLNSHSFNFGLKPAGDLQRLADVRRVPQLPPEELKAVTLPPLAFNDGPSSPPQRIADGESLPKMNITLPPLSVTTAPSPPPSASTLPPPAQVDSSAPTSSDAAKQ